MGDESVISSMPVGPNGGLPDATWGMCDENDVDKIITVSEWQAMANLGTKRVFIKMPPPQRREGAPSGSWGWFEIHLRAPGVGFTETPFARGNFDSGYGLDLPRPHAFVDLTYEDREPQPGDGPDYHHDHAAWELRQGTER